ncbi:MAG: glycosyltransferase family 39 protein [Candidatus Omnitrophota bacterium]
MDNILEKPGYFVSITLVLCAYLFFFQLGGMALTDPDETFYAQSAKEMLARNEWVTPYLYGKPQFEKPILIYWLIGLSYKIFGINEFAARLPSAIFALIGVFAAYLLGGLLFNRRVGALSAVILASCVEYIILSRACVTDMVLSTFMLLGVLFFFYGYLKGKKYCYLLSSAAFACAALAKGPVAVILPGAAILIFLILAKDIKAIGKMPIALIVLVFIAVAGPWYFLAYKYHGREFLDAFFGFQNITRFTQSEHKIGSQFYYNIPVLFGGFFPWSAFLPYGAWHLFKKTFKKAQDGNAGLDACSGRKGSIFILIWFFVIFIFFSISSTKLPTYIFPCFIAPALISAVFWDDFLKKDARRNMKAAMGISVYLLIAAVAMGSMGASLYIKYDYPSIFSGVAVSSLLLIFGFALVFISYFRKKYIASFAFIVYSLVIFLYPLNRLVIPEIEHYETSKPAAEELDILTKKDERIGSESNYLAGLAFYTGKFPVDLDKHHNMVNFINAKDRVWAVIKEKNHIQLYDPKINKDFVNASYMVYKIGKRAIVTNKLPPDGKYLIKRENPK